jgi:hypothetical protein
MPLSVLWWMIFVLWLIFGVWLYWPNAAAPVWRPWGNQLLLVILLFLLGLRVFGFIITG